MHAGSVAGSHTRDAGHDTGHLGGTDMIVGIDTFLRDAAGDYAADDVLLVGASASYGFGMGFVRRVGD